MTDNGHELVRDTWRQQAADLSEELKVHITWCPLGFEVPGVGGISHVSSPDAVRTMVGSVGWREYLARKRSGQLADLKDHWGEAYEFGWDGQFYAERRDNGKVVRRAEASDLLTEIRIDYSDHPVARDWDYATASHLDPDDLQRDGIDPR
jgi:hypothetical protein